MLPLFQLGEDPGLLTFPFEAAEGIFKSLVFFYMNERHSSDIPPFFLNWSDAGFEP
jgi:hypothetical protein